SDPFDDDPSVLRAVLSCGHVTSADTLTDCCKAQLDKGQTYFECPLCQEQWPYDEVRKLAKLIPSEKLEFEERLWENATADTKTCPGCGTYSKRTDASNLCVQCNVCTVRKGRVYEFCWQCEREWKGRRPRADRCDNNNCTQSEQDILRNCPMITLKNVENVQCPSFRACTNCQVLIEHTGEGCKIMTCKNCEQEFCFICLKSANNCLSTKTHFKVCINGVAPRQE
ncbi:E3 ubiquitin-protein ligase RNF19A-like, partial [Megalobrama amblycephala]|uniref:E3 ubiquitin-protein ligase RNF19A-like n=1 Tax=Megalobrama amblycephala TaxID=75352 RepID=UPI002013CDE1